MQIQNVEPVRRNQLSDFVISFQNKNSRNKQMLSVSE